MRPMFLLGRAIFGGFFLYSGLNHFLQRSQLSRYAASKGVAQPDAAVAISGALLLAGGASVIAGARPRQGLAAVIAFLIPVSLTMHRFWELDDPAARTSEMVNFTKNAALIGAALALMQIEQPWPISVDESLADTDEMYVRLGDRELRSLPA